MCLQKLPTAAHDGILSKPEELVGRLAIREAMGSSVTRLSPSESRHVPQGHSKAFAMAALRYIRPKPK